MSNTTTIIPLVTFISGHPMQPIHSEPGDALVIDNQEAMDWVARDFAQASASASFESSDDLGLNDASIDAIVDAIAELPSSGFSKDGKPNVKSLQNILEVEVTATQRDEAWARFQALKDA